MPESLSRVLSALGDDLPLVNDGVHRVFERESDEDGAWLDEVGIRRHAEWAPPEPLEEAA